MKVLEEQNEELQEIINSKGNNKSDSKFKKELTKLKS